MEQIRSFSERDFDCTKKRGLNSIPFQKNIMKKSPVRQSKDDKRQNTGCGNLHKQWNHQTWRQTSNSFPILF
jgi:hypothetical protein